MTDLINYQFQYRDFVFGNGTYFGIESVEGIDGFNVRRNDSNISRGHGTIPGMHFLEENDIIFKLTIDRNEFDEVEEALQEFKRGFTISEIYEPDMDKLIFRLPGTGGRMVKARPLGTPVVRSAVPGAHIIKMSAAFICNDPRVYSVEEKSTNLIPFAPLGISVNYDLNYEINWPSGDAFGGEDGVVNNAGNAKAWPLIRIHGPNEGSTTRFILQNLTYGSVIDVSTPVLNGQVLHMDMDAIATANGKLPLTVDGDNRYHGWALPRDPFFLGPGSNLLRLSVEGDTQGVVGVVTWRDTYQ